MTNTDLNKTQNSLQTCCVTYCSYSMPGQIIIGSRYTGCPARRLLFGLASTWNFGQKVNYKPQ